MKKSRMHICGSSDQGKTRTDNQDVYIIQKIWNEDTVLAAVIDGVGGYLGGAKAAAIAKESIIKYLETFKNGERGQLLKEAVAEANNQVNEGRLKETEFANMSCVLSVALVDFVSMEVAFAHVGDTRVYKFKNGILKKISHDHSLVGYREEIGELTEQEAMAHPRRNVISRDLGSSKHNPDDKDFIEMQTAPFEPGTTLLLCSDGLTDLVTSSQIVGILNKDLALEKKCDRLIKTANDAGGTDNITVVLVEFAKPDPEAHNSNKTSMAPNGQAIPFFEEPTFGEVIIPAEKSAPSKNRPKWFGSAILYILLLLIAALIAWIVLDKINS